MKKSAGAKRKLSRRRRGAGSRPSAPHAGAAALLLTGSFSMAMVPVHAAGLPLPCPGSSICATQNFNALNPAAGTSQLNYAGNNLTVNQGSAATAIFNWASFNIGAGNSVTFNQPSMSAVALNRIFDPNVTTISGNLHANGQIYLVNPNGILFGGTANVNVGGLIASTLDISNARIVNGLLSDTSLTDPAFSSNASLTGSPLGPQAANAAITIQGGASLYASGRDQMGNIVSAGRIFLFAPQVENAGTITVDGGGQAILAAGNNVYLGSSTDPSLRGLLVEVTGGSTPSVTIDPTGSITVARGNITLMGLAVNLAPGQNGSGPALTATSAQDANGSIYLLARQGDPTTLNVTSSSLFNAAETGPVTIGSGSKIKVVLDPTDTASAPAGDPTASSLHSVIDVQGSAVAIGGSGPANSTLLEAHGGDISVTARAASSTLDNNSYSTGSSVLGTQNAAATVTVGSDALLDVSGLQNVQVDGAQNFAYIDRLTSSNLANAPYQRNGFLLGQSLWVNLNDVPSWLNVSNLQAAVTETQAQRNTVAGSIDLYAEGSVSIAHGATLNVSGGSIDYTAAIGRTSNLIAANGSVVNISNASQDTQYIGFAGQGSSTVSDPIEGISVTTTWSLPYYSFVGGYTAGTNAGTINLYAPRIQINGNLLATTISSTEQRGAPPLGGLLQIGSVNPGNLDTEAAFSRPGIVLTSDPASGATALASVEADAPVVLDSTSLVGNGFSRFDLTSDGAVLIAGPSPLNLGAGGQLTVRANATLVDSSISAPGGSISISERPLTALPGGDTLYGDESGLRDQLNLVSVPGLRGAAQFAPGVTLDVAGTWTNDRYPTPAANPLAPIVLNGGSISVSDRNVNVGGVVFDVSSGADYSTGGAFTGGQGGSLSLSGTYAQPSPTGTSDSGQLVLGSDFASSIFGFGTTKGGSLSLYAPNLVIGSGASTTLGPATTVVDPAVLQQGFQSFKFAALDSVTVTPGTTLAPDVRLIPNSANLDTSVSASVLPPAATPLAAVPGQAYASSFTFTASNAYDGTVTIGSQSVVDAGTGTGASIALNAGDRIQVDGQLTAWGGTVNATLGGLPVLNLTAAQIVGRGIVLDPGATIDVSGASLVTANALGVRSGNVLGAGSVSLNANQGTLAVESGALIEAQGASDTVDIAVNGTQSQRQAIATAGGNIVLSGSNGVIVEGGLLANGAGATAGGGALSVSLVAESSATINGLANQPALQALLAVPSNLQVGGTAPALAGAQASFSATQGQAYISAATLNNAGFSRIWLQSPDAITFTGGTPGAPLQLSAPAAYAIAAPTLAVSAGSAVDIASPYVALGQVEALSSATSAQAISLHAVPAASGGSGTLRVDAGSIDVVGTVSFQDVGLATLSASGDLRLIGVANPAVPGPTVSGALDFAGNLALDAARVYPSTETQFAINGPTDTATAGNLVVGSAGASFASGAAPAPILSAGGSIAINTGSVDVQGSLDAPLGSLAINAARTLTLEPGSLVSVAGDALVPFGTVLNGTTWVYNLPGNYATNTTNPTPVSTYAVASTTGISIPSKSISLKAGTLVSSAGSTIDIAGGGDLLGTGFVAGPGGSYDWSTNYPNGTRNPFFALVPTQGSATTAFDSQIFSDLVLNPALASNSSTSFLMGQTITIAAGSTLPAGTYTVLPAKYALLPGAFAVEAVAGYQNMVPGSTAAMPDGSTIVAGKLGDAAAGLLAPEWSGYRVYTTAQFQSFSQFEYYTGSATLATFAADLGVSAPRLGTDAGQLQIAASSIAVDGSITAQAQSGGRGADIEIDVPVIQVVDATPPATGPSSTLTLTASELDQFSAQTLILGALGTRTTATTASGAAGGSTLTLGNPVASTSVSVQSTHALTAGEIVLASSTVQVADGATLATSSSNTVSTNQIDASGAGALLYLGNSVQAPGFTRPPATGTGGVLAIGAANLSAGSLVVDATSSQTYGNGISIQAGSVNLSATRLNLGDAIPSGAGATAGTVNLDSQVLADFGSARNLTLTSLDGIDVYGTANLGQAASNGQPVLDSVRLVGPGVAAAGGSAATLTVLAGDISLANPTSASLAAAGSPGGQANFTATARGSSTGSIDILGAIAFDGFQGANFTAIGTTAAGRTTAGTGDFVFTGASGSAASVSLLTAGANLGISAARVTAQSGVNAAISAAGSVLLGASGPAPSAYDLYGLGASLNVNAADITVAGRLDFPSGAVGLLASGAGGIGITSGGLIRVAGVTQTFASTTADAPAGSVSLSAAAGPVSEAAGATLDLSGSGASGDAGTLVVSAPTGTVSLAGTVALTPGAGGQGASVSIDAGSLANADALAGAISAGAAGGSLNSVSLRARNGNISLSGGPNPTTLAANQIMLEADGGGGASDGSILMNGVLTASGTAGGQVGLFANNQIQVGGTIDVHATGAGQSGGEVLLSSRVTTTPGAATTLDAIVLQPGASIALNGGVGGSDGALVLRSIVAPNGRDVEIAPFNPAQVTANQAPDILVEAVKIDSYSAPLYIGANDGSLAANATSTTWEAEAALLTPLMTAGNVAAMTSRLLGTASDANFAIRPGLEIVSSGTININEAVDFSSGLASNATGRGTFAWRYGGTTLATSQPGALTVLAGGDLNVQASISDGFLTGTDINGNPTAALWNSGNSWRYTLTAGADSSAANPNQTVAGAGSLYVGTTAEPGVVVRTGTGSIALNAGGDVVLNNGAGQQDNVVYTAGVASVSHPALSSYPNPGNDIYGNPIASLAPVLAQNGGNLSVEARGDILGTDTAGDNQSGSQQTITEWLFRYGSGTSRLPTVWWTDFNSFQQGFGALGGGNLSLVAGGDIVRVGAVVPTNGYAMNGQVHTFNTGSLTVTAGGAIVQGLYYDEAGAFNLRATSLQSNPADGSISTNVRLAQGDNAINIVVSQGGQFELPFNPSATPISANLTNTGSSDTNEFFTFGPGTSLNVVASSGDVVALAATGGASVTIDNAFANYAVTSPSIRLTAFGGSIVSSAIATQYPSATGQLSLLADGSVGGTAQNSLSIAMSQSDPALQPSAAAPLQINNPSNTQVNLATPLASSVPLHANDPNAAEIVARTGDITDVYLQIPKTTEISAGGNIGPFATINIQNSSSGSLTTIAAGGQINLTGDRYDSITIGGPGAAQVVSGGAMNLGVDGLGITSIGNLGNLQLPAQGASLIVVAGAGSVVKADGYAAATPDYLNLIDNFVRYDAFAAEGSNAANLNQQVLAALYADKSLTPLYQALGVGLAARGSVDQSGSAFNQMIAQLTPAQIAVGAVKLASAIQTVTNAQFIGSSNADTFAPAYAAFNDLFPNLSNSTQFIEHFTASNPFANAGASAPALQASVLQNLPSGFATLLGQGLSDPASAANPSSSFAQALAAIDPVTLQADARALLASVLQVAGASLNTLSANGQLSGSGTPYAKALTSLAGAATPQTPAGINDLHMEYNEIKTEQTGTIAILDPQGSVNVGQDSPPVLDPVAKLKSASELGIFTLGGGDIIGMVRDDFNVFQSRVFTVAGGNISLWSSEGNIDAGRGPRDVAVVAPPTLEMDPNTGVVFLDFGASVSGSGIGALETSPNQPPSNINLMAPVGYVDAGEAGIRAQTGKVLLGTNLVINGSNIQAASGVSGGAVVAAPPPPPPPSTSTSSGDKVAEQAQRDAIAQQLASEERSANQVRLRVNGEFLGFERDCAADKHDEDCAARDKSGN